jgi:aryl-alcohol dehydrogenase-like predicted oxidoreductase
MKYQRLGRSGQLVSELSFGTMTFGNAGHRKDVMGVQTLPAPVGRSTCA